MRSLWKSAFWLISSKPLEQSKKFLWLDNTFLPTYHPLAWILLYFSPISRIFFLYGQNLGFGLKFCINFDDSILIYILRPYIDMLESESQWVYLNHEKPFNRTGCIAIWYVHIIEWWFYDISNRLILQSYVNIIILLFYYSLKSILDNRLERTEMFLECKQGSIKLFYEGPSYSSSLYCRAMK